MRRHICMYIVCAGKIEQQRSTRSWREENYFGRSNNDGMRCHFPGENVIASGNLEGNCQHLLFFIGYYGGVELRGILCMYFNTEFASLWIILIQRQKDGRS